MKKAILPILALGGLLHATDAAVILAADDFSEANGTLLHNKAADVGGNWNVTVNNTVTIQGNAFDTDQAPGVRAFLNFGQALGAGEIFRFEFTTLATAGSMFTASGGFAGFSFFEGGTERIFVGDPGAIAVESSAQNWSLGGPSLATTQTDITAEAVSGIFTYNFDTGAASLFVDDGTNTDTINFSYTAGYALDQLRIGSGNGASEINVDSFSITAIPEPSAALLGSVGILLLLRRRRIG